MVRARGGRKIKEAVGCCWSRSEDVEENKREGVSRVY